MTTANDIIFLSLRNSGVNGVGQSPLPEDVNDSFTILNAWIEEINLERQVTANRIILPTFPDLTTDVPFWSKFRHVLLTTMAVRLRQIYSLPAVDLDVKLAVAAMQAFNAINLQQVAPVIAGVPDSVRQVIFLALRMAGRINDKQSVADGSADVNDALSLLVMMLHQWQRKRWLAWNEKETSCVSTGADWYHIGTGHDFDTIRPDKLHAAFARLRPFSYNVPSDEPLPVMLPYFFGGSPTAMVGQHPVDISLTIIEAKEDWSRLAIKNLQSVPAAVFYDSAFPVGRLFFWPVPPAGQYDLHVLTKAELPAYKSLDDTIDLPPEYLDAVVNNLACRIVVASGGQISPFLAGQARASLETIRMANSQIPLLSLPPELSGLHGGDSGWIGQGLDQAWTVGGPSVLT